MIHFYNEYNLNDNRKKTIERMRKKKVNNKI